MALYKEHGETKVGLRPFADVGTEVGRMTVNWGDRLLVASAFLANNKG